jgi:hypothetical protein
MDHEQRINMKFCFKQQKSAKEIQEMLKLVYGDAAVNMKTVYKNLGRPSTSKTQEN